jgi:tetratricopeptide (TPR) repeat protein
MEVQMSFFRGCFPQSVFPLLVVLTFLACGSNPAERRAKHMKRGDAYFEKEEFKKAIIEYKNAIQAEPKFARGHYQIALAYLRTGQPKQAFPELSKTVDLNPENLDAQLKLGQFYLLARQTAEAADKALLVLQAEPDNIDALFLQMALLLQEGKSDEAIDVLKKVTAIDEKNIRAYISLARIAGSQKRFTEAEGYLTKAVGASPEDPDPRLELARFYEQRGEFEEAKKILEEAIARNKTNVALLGQLGNFYVRRANLEAAEDTYLKMATQAPDHLGPKMTLGAFYASQKNWQEALQWMQEAQKLQPKDVEIQNAIASLYMDMGRPDETKRLIDDVLETDKSNLRARLLKARLLITDKQWSKAGDVLEAIIRDYPRHAGAYHYLGLVYVAQKDQKKAKGAFLKAVEYNPGNLNARILLAESFLAERAPDLALEQLKSVLDERPQDYQAHVLQGTAYLLKRNMTAAKDAFSHAIDLRPDDPTGYYRLAIVSRGEGQYGETMKHLDRVLALQPDHIPALAAKVSLYVAQEQPTQALSFLDEQIRGHEKNLALAPVLHEMQGTVLFSQNNYEAAERALKKALDLNPDLVGPYVVLANLYLKKNETNKAITQYKEILEKRPKFIQAHMALGAIYDAEGKSAEAQAMYEKALEISPNFAPAANNLAWLLLEQGQEPDRSLMLAKKAKAQLPDDPRVADTLGRACIVKGLYDSAIAELSDAAEKMPENPTVLYHLGLAYWRNDEKHQAVEALAKALKIKKAFPERQAAAQLLQEIEAS